MMSCLTFDELPHARFESLLLLPLHPVAGIGNDVAIEAGLNATQYAKFLLDIRHAGDVLLAPDLAEPRRGAWQGVDECVSESNWPAVEPRAPRILVLKMNRERVDPAFIAEHELCEVAALKSPDLLGAHARLDALQIGTLRPRQAQARRADHHKASDALAHLRCDMAAHDRAERKARHRDCSGRRHDLIEAMNENFGERVSAMRKRRNRRIAEAGHIGRDHSVALRQGRDVAQPMRPGAIAAMQQNQG